MNDIVNENNLEKIIEDCKKIINEIEERGIEPKIKNTKVSKWLSSLEKSFNHKLEEDVKKFIKINKYNRVLKFIISNSNNIKPETIKEIISGSDLILDDSHKSENYFFEVDIADRLMKSINTPSSPKKIDLYSNTDIILNNDIFVECKKIHGENSFKDNIKKANKQIKNANLCSTQKAFIALELTVVFDSKKNDVIQLSNKNSEYFRDSYEKLGINDNYICNLNYRKVVQSLLVSKLEFIFIKLMNEFYRKNKKFKFDEHVIGIFYQYDTYFITPTSDLIPIRGASYYKLEEKTEDFFESLVTGI